MMQTIKDSSAKCWATLDWILQELVRLDADADVDVDIDIDVDVALLVFSQHNSHTKRALTWNTTCRSGEMVLSEEG